MRQQMVTAEQDPALGVPEQGVRRAVARPVQHLQAAGAERQLVAVSERSGDPRAGAEGAKRGPDGGQRRGQVIRDAVAAHDAHREVVIGPDPGAEALEVAGEQVQGRDLGS